MAKAQRNDASAVAKAARAVSRPVAEALIRLRLGARLPKVVAQPVTLPEPMPEPVPTPSDALTRISEAASAALGSSSGGRRRRRSSPRRNANLDYRKVTRTAFGTLPRYGTKRWDKMKTVRDALDQAADGYLYVWQLVGRHYDTSADTLSIHDLDVMVEKRLININD